MKVVLSFLWGVAVELLFLLMPILVTVFLFASLVLGNLLTYKIPADARLDCNLALTDVIVWTQWTKLFLQSTLGMAATILMAAVYSYWAREHGDYDNDPIPYAYFFIALSFAGYMVFTFAEIYAVLGIQGAKITDPARDFLYFSIVTMTTVGYGDFHPCPEARPFAAAQASMSIVLTPVLITACLAMWSARRE
jgi:hypothetical protein